jgi:hypothetical protein
MGKYARCETHQREYWRRDNESDRVRGHNALLHKALRAQVLAEEGRCANPHCVRPYESPTLDYIIPLSAGGQQCGRTRSACA